MARSTGSVGVLPVGSSLSALKGRTMVRPTLTVRTRPGDNLAVHVALEAARPGDGLVIDTRGDTTYAALGGLITRYAATRGVAGPVVDGAARDYDDLSAGDVPVFARGLSYTDPSASAGWLVNDADLMVATPIGSSCCRPGVAQILAEGERVLAREQEQHKAIDAGAWDRNWLADVRCIEMTGAGPAAAG